VRRVRKGAALLSGDSLALAIESADYVCVATFPAGPTVGSARIGSCAGYSGT
jgi:hypothetical protein